MSQRILVTGATGHIGRELVRELQRTNADFAVMTSPSGRTTPDVPSVEGDFNDLRSLERAFRGFDVLFLLLPLVPNKLALALNAVQAAAAAGIRHIVRSSAAGADAASAIAIARLHGTIDEQVKSSGLSWTLLRPSFFMQNWTSYYADQVRAGIYRAPQGTGSIALVDVRDIAECAAIVLSHPKSHERRVHTLTGDEALTNEEQLAIIADATGRRIDYADVPEADAWTAMLAAGIPEVVADWHMSLNYVVKQGWAGLRTNDVAELTGRDPRRFRAFVDENVDTWR